MFDSIIIAAHKSHSAIEMTQLTCETPLDNDLGLLLNIFSDPNKSSHTSLVG